MQPKPKECTSKSKHSPTRNSHSNTHISAPPRSGREKLRKSPPHTERAEKYSQAPAVSSLSAPLATTAANIHLPSTSTAATDFNQYAASQYQLMCQKILYQKELEKLQLSLNNMNSYVHPTPSFNMPDSMGLVSPTGSPSFNPTDFAKLAAFFYQKLEQTAPVAVNPLTADTEALQNYRKMFVDSNCNDFLAPLTQQFKPPSPQLHECHWVTSNGICGKKHYSYDDLMLHLRSHVSVSPDSLPTLRSSLNKSSDGLPTLRSNIMSSLPSPLGLSSTEYKYNQTLDTLTNKAFTSHNPTRYQPYSLPPRQLPVPFL